MGLKKVYILSVAAALSIIVIILYYSSLHFKAQPVSIKSPKKDKIQLKFVSSWGGSDTKAGSLEKFLTRFQDENPDIEIINESMSGEEFLFTLKMAFAQGNEPDVFGLWPGSDIINLIEAGKVADLTEELTKDEKWYNSFDKDIWAYDTHYGSIYGLPCEIIYEGLFINKDLFEKYNVKIPENYEELKDACRIFVNKGIIPIAYNSTAEGTYLYQNIVMKLAGKEGTENPFYGDRLNSSFLYGMKYMKELYDMGAFPKDCFTIDNVTRNMLFVNKKAAMIVQGSWFIGNGFISALDKTVDVVPFPSFKDGKAKKDAIIYGIGNGNFHISMKSWKDERKREACLKLLKAITTVDTSKFFANETGYISSVKIPQNDLENMGLIRKGYEMIRNSNELIGPTDSFVIRTVWEDILAKKFPVVLEKKISPENLFDELEKKMRDKN